MFHSRTAQTRSSHLTIFLLMSLLFSLTVVLRGQTPPAQLSLADILVGLRSKKVTLAVRNALLTDAVKTRGITFALTPEIERELGSTGASAELIGAIREKSPKIITISTPAPLRTPEPTPPPTLISTRTPTPMPTPTPPDAAFYRTRANAHIVKAEYDSAIADYGKAIELNPKDSMTYFFRGDSYEKTGDLEKAVADYQKAVESDENNEPAKNNLQRLQAKQSKTLPNSQTEVAAPATESAAPQSVEVGELNALAVKLVAPIYPDIAKKLNAQGKVVVQIMLDKEGNVMSAKAISGQQLLRSTCEEAAFRSKFKPARFGNQTIKATGFISYNFTK